MFQYAIAGGPLRHPGFAALRCSVVAAILAAAAAALAQSAASPTIVQPGAPGASNKTLSVADAKASEVRQPPTKADVDFMQGMIMHHGQAVEMTELLKSRTRDAQVREIGRKIDLSQTDEMRWMKQWLTDRGFPISAPMGGMDMGGMDMKDTKGMDMGDMKGMDMPAMPGMLTRAQMETLRKATGLQFDHLFLTGMIQHHSGALTMVKDLFATQGAGQDPQLFDFASDVDNTQQAEIDIMRHMLKERP